MMRGAWIIIYLCLFGGGIAPISSFAPSGKLLISRRKQHDSQTHRIPQTQTIASISYAATTSLSLKSNTQATTQEISNGLLYKLQQKAAASTNSETLDSEINNLVRSLIDLKAKFNPATCIDGPLFASVHFIGDSPLWARIGAGVVRNIKGQKYTLQNMMFTNYAEILGTNFYLKAVGTFKDEGPVVSSSLSSTSVDSANSEQSNPFGAAFASLFNYGNNSKSKSKSKQQSTSLPTPYDYSATVTGASIVLFQRFSVDLTIEGTGTVRVLFADDNLRIFLSPTDTNVTKGGGDWESEGLIVVQVRVDLVYNDWIDEL